MNFSINLFVAMGSTVSGQNGQPRIVSSSDGITWTLRASLTGNSASGTGNILWAPEISLFVAAITSSASAAVAPFNSIATSTDGLIWTTSSTFFQPPSQALYVGWNGTQFMISGTGGSNTLVASSNGISFTPLGTPFHSVRTGAVCASAFFSRWVFVGHFPLSVQSQSFIDGSTTFGSYAASQGYSCYARR